MVFFAAATAVAASCGCATALRFRSKGIYESQSKVTIKVIVILGSAIIAAVTTVDLPMRIPIKAIKIFIPLNQLILVFFASSLILTVAITSAHKALAVFFLV